MKAIKQLGCAALVLAVLACRSCALQTTSSSCGVPMAPQFLPFPRCPPTNKTLEDAKRAAWRLAPILYMHPLEKYHLQTYPDWFAEAEIYYNDLKNGSSSSFSWVDDSYLTDLMFGPKTFATLLNSSRVSEQRRQQLLAGAPVDARNRSTATVYFTAVQLPEDVAGPGVWQLTYTYFYSFNGCSNQDLALSFDGRQTVMEYMMCPMGVHECDQEHISMLVCAETEAIQQTAYSQHDWWETRDCTKGQCPMQQHPDVDAKQEHPVSHAGLEGHGNYYDEKPLMFYAMKNATFKKVSLENLGGVWIGDRTLRDPYWSFVPTPDNIKYLKTMEEILALPETGPGETQETWAWATFPGQWGIPLAHNKTTYFCFYDNQTRLAECPPDEPATRILQSVGSLLDVAQTVVGSGGSTTSTSDSQGQQSFYVGAGGSNSSVMTVKPTVWPGPLFRLWNYNWLPQVIAPINQEYLNNQNATISCPTEARITLEYPGPESFDTKTTVQTIENYLIGICAAALAISIIIVLFMAIPGWFSKAVDSPTLLIARAKREYAKWSAGLKTSPAPDTAIDIVGGEGPSSRTLADAAHGASMKPLPQGSPACAPVEETTAPACGKAAFEGELEVVPEMRRGAKTPFLFYTLFAWALYIAGVVLLALGLHQFVENSVAALATHVARQSSVMDVIKWLIIACMIIMGFFDITAAFVILIAHRPRIGVRRWSYRNPLYSAAVHRHAYKLHIYMAGCIVLCISISTVLFGLGLVVTVVQLAVRLVCSQVVNVNVDGVSSASICISVPALQEEPICGWQAMEVCYDATKMGVLLMVLGSMLLLWSHVIWLTILLLSMWRFQKLKVKTVPQAGEAELPDTAGLVGAGEAAGGDELQDHD